jgi:hypothetical protein
MSKFLLLKQTIFHVSLQGNISKAVIPAVFVPTGFTLNPLETFVWNIGVRAAAPPKHLVVVRAAVNASRGCLSSRWLLLPKVDSPITRELQQLSLHQLMRKILSKQNTSFQSNPPRRSRESFWRLALVIGSVAARAPSRPKMRLRLRAQTFSPRAFQVEGSERQSVLGADGHLMMASRHHITRGGHRSAK